MRPLVLFYILVIYVLFQFSWWAYLLVELNFEVYELKMELLRSGADPTEVSESSMYLEQLEKRWMMVAGEGMVFLTLLVIGIYKTRQSFKKEFELARQQKNFLLSITHEFKSPLAAVKLNLQTLQKRELPKEQREKIIDIAVSETDRIDNLVENALIATRIESRNLDIQRTDLDLSGAVNSAVERLRMTHSDEIRIGVEIEDDVMVQGDQLAIASLLHNLLENAVKYSTGTPEVHVSLSTIRKNAVLRVSDKGIGISDEEKNVVFKKFYRVGNEETRKSKGTGLGLFIVKHIVDLHGGRIDIYDNIPAGSIFEVTLPLSQ
jgi:signal transduction histidine kinase